MWKLGGEPPLSLHTPSSTTHYFLHGSGEHPLPCAEVSPPSFLSMPLVFLGGLGSLQVRSLPKLSTYNAMYNYKTQLPHPNERPESQRHCRLTFETHPWLDQGHICDLLLEGHNILLSLKSWPQNTPKQSLSVTICAALVPYTRCHKLQYFLSRCNIGFGIWSQLDILNYGRKAFKLNSFLNKTLPTLRPGTRWCA